MRIAPPDYRPTEAELQAQDRVLNKVLAICGGILTVCILAGGWSWWLILLTWAVCGFGIVAQRPNGR